MMCWCVGFARTPFSAIFKQTSHASLPFIGLMITAFNRPLPRIFSIIGDLIFMISSRKILPRYSALSVSFSSLITSKAAILTRVANGLPPNVDPCSPGFIVNMISSSANAAEIGNTPPPRALPRIRMSGRTPSWSQASILPVRAIPHCTSSAMNNTLYFLQMS